MCRIVLKLVISRYMCGSMGKGEGKGSSFCLNKDLVISLGW